MGACRITTTAHPDDAARQATPPAGAGGILAIHPGALGDVLLLGRMLQELPGVVTLVAGQAVGELLAGLGVVGRPLNFHSLPMHELFADTPPAAGVLGRLLGAHEHVVSCLDQRPQARRLLESVTSAGRIDLLPIRPPDSWTGHLTDLWARRLAAPAPAATAWPVPDAWRLRGREALGGAGIPPDAPCVLLHPGAGAPPKCWPAERFVELAQRLGRRGDSVAWVLGPVELETWPPQKTALLCGTGAVLAAMDLPALAGAIAHADAFVGNDSGVSHLSGLLGTATVALFGPTRPEHFRPLGPRVHVLQAQPLADLDPSAVLAAIDQARSAANS